MQSGFLVFILLRLRSLNLDGFYLSTVEVACHHVVTAVDSEEVAADGFPRQLRWIERRRQQLFGVRSRKTDARLALLRDFFFLNSQAWPKDHLFCSLLYFLHTQVRLDLLVAPTDFLCFPHLVSQNRMAFTMVWTCRSISFLSSVIPSSLSSRYSLDNASATGISLPSLNMTATRCGRSASSTRCNLVACDVDFLKIGSSGLW